MLSALDAALVLMEGLRKYGDCGLTKSISIFPADRPANPGISGKIEGQSYSGTVFDPAPNIGIICPSVYLTTTLAASDFEDGHIAFWNADNRFSKIYKADGKILLVMDSMLNDVDIANSVAGMWNASIKTIPASIIAYARHKDRGEMFDFFKPKPKPAPAPEAPFELNNVEDLQNLKDLKGTPFMLKAIREAAEAGNHFCQIFLSNGLAMAPPQTRGPGYDAEFEKYTRLAAEGGDANSQINLATFYLKKVDFEVECFNENDVQNIRLSKHWHRAAAAQGIEKSVESLKALEIFEVH